MNKEYNAMIYKGDDGILHITAMEVGPKITIDGYLEYLKTQYGDSNITIMVDNSLSDGGFFDELREKADKNITVIYNMSETQEKEKVSPYINCYIAAVDPSENINPNRRISSDKKYNLHVSEFERESDVVTVYVELDPSEPLQSIDDFRNSLREKYPNLLVLSRIGEQLEKTDFGSTLLFCNCEDKRIKSTNLTKEKQMEGFLERLITEEKELREKLGKLYSFIVSDNFANLTEMNRGLLKQQKDAMEEYLEILQVRIEENTEKP